MSLIIRSTNLGKAAMLAVAPHGFQRTARRNALAAATVVQTTRCERAEAFAAFAAFEAPARVEAQPAAS